MTPQQFCISECVRTARAMSYCDCLRFLHGMLLLCGDCSEVADLRLALIAIEGGDRQLQLIAEAQGRLPLDGKNGPDGKDGAA